MTEEIVRKIRRNYANRHTRDINFRRTQIESILRMLNENEAIFVDALLKDLRKPSFETRLLEIEFIRNDCRGMIYNLSKYTAPTRVGRNMIMIADDALVYPQPYGVILIIGTWNYPLMTVISPLVGAIAAGNACIMKTSEIAPHTAEAIHSLLPRYIDNDCYHVITGGPEVSQELLKLKFDYIFFTGSNQIGKLVHSAAAKDLTPVTLELGGKSPVYVDGCLANMKVTCRRLLWGKLMNAGQTCVAPDYILCPADMKAKLISVIPEVVKEFHGVDLKCSKNYARIVNRKQFDRLRNLLETTKGKIVYGGQHDADELYLALTLVTDVTQDDALMKQEIFGPILPILTVENEDEAIEFINSHPTPLTLYIFSDRREVIDKFISHTSSGSVCANDVVIHLAADTLPFGGLGESGFGAYHGKYTFDLFTHNKSVLVRGFNPIIEWVSSKRYPPYSNGHLVRLSRLLKKRRFFINVKNAKNLFWFFSGALCYHFANEFYRRYRHYLMGNVPHQ